MKYEYEVALSFAGEDRKFAEVIADGLRSAGVNIFYDDFYAEELWGEDLSVKLQNVYHSSSQFCIMIISEHYVNKMWPSHERQQAIERMIKEQGKTYILPVRLDGFSGKVPGLSGSISYLAVNRSSPKTIVDAFLRKIGRETGSAHKAVTEIGLPTPHIPKLRKTYSDKEKNQFLKASYEEIVNLIAESASATKKEYSHFDFEMERITSRKALFTLYGKDKQVSQFKIWIGGLLGGNSIAFSYGHNVDVDNDGSMNESFSLEEHEGQMKLKPMGMGMFGAERDKPMTPREASDYLWKIACQNL